jgi:hypothetical protein
MKELKRGEIMAYDFSNYLVIGISSRALFELSDEDGVYGIIKIVQMAR